MARDGSPFNLGFDANFDAFRKSLATARTDLNSTVSAMEKSFSSLNPDTSGIFDRFSKNAEASANQAGVGLGVVIAGGIIAGIAGIGAQLVSSVNSLAKVGDLADDMRLPVNVLQALSVAATEARVPAERLSEGLKKFTEVSKQSAEDGEKFYKALGNIGAGFVDAFKTAPTQVDRLRILMDAMKSTSDEVKRAQLSLQAFGTDNERFIRIIGVGADGLGKYIEDVRRLGLMIDETFVRQAQEAKSQIALFTRVLGDEFSPTVANLIPLLVQMLPALQGIAQAVVSTLGAFGTVLGNGSDATRTTEQLQQELGVLTRSIDGLLEQRDRLMTGERSPADELRDDIRKFLGIEATVADEVRGLDEQIAKAMNRIADLDRFLEDRKRGNISAPSQSAFAPRPSLASTSSTRDRFDSAADSIEKRTAALATEAATINLSTAAREKAIITAQLETVAMQINKEAKLGDNIVTAEQRDRIEEVAEAYAKAAVAIENARSPLAQFARDSANIGKQLNQFAASSLDTVTNELANVVTGTKSASEAFRNMANSIIQDLARIAIRQAITGPIASGLSSLFGGPAGVGMNGMPVFIGANAGGTDNWRGGPTWVGERGPEIVNLPRGTQIVPNHLTGGRAMNITIGGSSIVIEGNASDDTVQQLAAEMARDRNTRRDQFKSFMAEHQTRTGLAS